MADERAVSDLNGPRKAAIILLTVNEDRRRAILSRMDEQDVRRMAKAMAHLGDVPASTVERLIGEFDSRLSSTNMVVGNFEETERTLRLRLPDDRVSEIMEEIRGPEGRDMWERLSNVNETNLASYLRGETPQVAAVILSKIKQQSASKVLREIAKGKSSHAGLIVHRMLKLDAIQRGVLAQVEKTLQSDLLSSLSRTQNKKDPHIHAAEIFNLLDSQSEQSIMAALEALDREGADKVRAFMFTFQDIARLDDDSLRLFIPACDVAKLPAAIKNADPEFVERVFKSMPKSQAQILQDEVEGLSTVRKRDEEEARRHMVMIAKSMLDKGEIYLMDREESEEMAP